MTPTQSTQPTMAVVIDRLDGIARSITDLSEKIECLDTKQRDFILQYTKAHTELEAELRRVNDKAERAHERIDSLAKLLWGIATPLILFVLTWLGERILSLIQGTP